MKNSRILLVALAAGLFLSTTGPARAQGGPGGGNAGGVSPAMLKLFGDTKAFSAKADMRMLRVVEGAQMEAMSGTIGFALLDGKTRVDMNLTQMKNALMPLKMTEMLIGLGMDTNIIIFLPDKQMTYAILPSLKAFVEMPLPKEQAATEAGFKVETKELGKEVIDGHPCVKNKVTVTDAAGKKTEAIAWNATDLKGFPVQFETQEQGSTVIMRYKEIKLAKPDAKLFEPPTGFKKYASHQELMQTEVSKRLGGK